MTDEIHTYVKLRKGFENSSGKLEESGKILGKDLWVMGPLKRNTIGKGRRMRNDAPERLKDLNEVTTSN